ncbi:hypothetical protein K458DRAFT_411161 [Lentithecium fluviatile CBS 122367]|uniref:Uncharacterized protein n=1 Tax=Lentithecium fluviatile CBS 122367 TaxID=1168545 RepID=A0A6G1JMT5_9PLEO|nr:hypothetical protein K458DRAFT_411161 [Lentithecium fluviatile CBS 122367]
MSCASYGLRSFGSCSLFLGSSYGILVSDNPSTDVGIIYHHGGDSVDSIFWSIPFGTTTVLLETTRMIIGYWFEITLSTHNNYPLPLCFSRGAPHLSYPFARFPLRGLVCWLVGRFSRDRG